MSEPPVHNHGAKGLLLIAVARCWIAGDEVVGGNSPPPTQPDAQPPAENGKAKLLLSGTVTEFEPGSQAERYLVGLGAGAAKLKMHFAFQDAATGKEILFTDHQHKFWIGAFGGSKNAATTRTAEGMVKSNRRRHQTQSLSVPRPKRSVTIGGVTPPFHHTQSQSCEA